MAYWNKRKEGWLPRYWCEELATGMIQRPRWCLFAKHNDITHKFCKGCPKKKEEAKNDK